MKQTAVEWLIQKLVELDKQLDGRRKNEDATVLKMNPTKIYEQAKQMEAEQSKILELSDEEIQNAAFQFIKPPKQKPCKSDGYNEYDLFEAFKAGVRYREQLKSKQ